MISQNMSHESSSSHPGTSGPDAVLSIETAYPSDAEAQQLQLLAQAQQRSTLTVEEAAEMLGLSRAFAYEAVNRGEIPAIRIGRRILVPKVALERLLNSADGQH